MTVTVLAVLFLLIILAITVIGYKTIATRVTSLKQETKETCSLCKKKFEKDQLIERQVGDYKILRFCRSCVESLLSQFTTHETQT